MPVRGMWTLEIPEERRRHWTNHNTPRARKRKAKRRNKRR